jgi:hypothetical protein
LRSSYREEEKEKEREKKKKTVFAAAQGCQRNENRH